MLSTVGSTAPAGISDDEGDRRGLDAADADEFSEAAVDVLDAGGGGGGGGS
jgi:hypothetical protein